MNTLAATTPAGSVTPAVPDQRSYRISSIDMLRGLVIALMAIDHARDFLMISSTQDPMSDPNVGPALFFTRWITHFCAPVFVLLAGTSAGLMSTRKSPQTLGSFLLKRGLWLIVVEIVFISFAWSFSISIPDFGGRYLVAMQVIWAIGASMVVLAGAQFLGRKACLAIGLILLIGHNALDPFWPTAGMLDVGLPLWASLHTQSAYVMGPFFVIGAYPLLPWIGVMLTGYGLAAVFERSPDERFRLLIRIGTVLTILFVVVRAIDLYGDPNGWIVQEGGAVATLIDFVNTTKYPPSLSFLLMTLGPALIFTAFAERMSGFLKDTLVMFGRVPFAFYVAHLYLLHLFAIVLGLFQGFAPSDFMTVFFLFPASFGLGLGGVYVGWLLAMVVLYPLCKWVAGVKARRKTWWLSYV